MKEGGKRESHMCQLQRSQGRPCRVSTYGTPPPPLNPNPQLTTNGFIDDTAITIEN